MADGKQSGPPPAPNSYLPKSWRAPGRRGAGGSLQASFNKVLVVRQAADEPAEGAFAGDFLPEPAGFPELPAAAQTLQELVVVANLEDELGEIGPPHGPQGVAFASDPAVLAEGIKDDPIFESIQDGGQEAIPAFRRLRRLNRLNSLCKMTVGHEETYLPGGLGPLGSELPLRLIFMPGLYYYKVLYLRYMHRIRLGYIHAQI